MTTRDLTHAEIERHRELLEAAGLSHERLTADEDRLLWWLCSWDEWTLNAAIALFRRLRAKAP